MVRVLYPRSGYYVSRTRGVAAARRCYIRQERRAPVATAVFHSALKPCAPRILLIRYIRKLIVIRWSRVYTRKSPRPSRLPIPFPHHTRKHTFLPPSLYLLSCACKGENRSCRRTPFIASISFDCDMNISQINIHNFTSVIVSNILSK